MTKNSNKLLPAKQGAIASSTTDDTAEPLITISNISYAFEGPPPIHAVHNVKFSIYQGKITAVIGESGSGKSTLLRLIFGLLPPGAGEIRYRGVLVPDPREVLIPGHPKMRMVSQAFDDLNTYATVWDNVSAQLSNTNIAAKQRETRKVLRWLRVLHLRDQRIFDLSGGEKQRVALATALVSNPEVLLMDEPFNQVDAAFRENLQRDIREIVTRTGVTVVMVSHDPAEVLALADHLLVMRKGRISANGQPQTLYDRPPNPYTAKLLARANVISVAEAHALGIPTEKPIGIHLHDIEAWPLADQKPSPRPTAVSSTRQTIRPKRPFTIQFIWFRGFHQELVVSNGAFELRCVACRSKVFREGEDVWLTIKDYWSFD